MLSDPRRQHKKNQGQSKQQSERLSQWTFFCEEGESSKDFWEVWLSEKTFA